MECATKSAMCKSVKEFAKVCRSAVQEWCRLLQCAICRLCKRVQCSVQECWWVDKSGWGRNDGSSWVGEPARGKYKQRNDDEDDDDYDDGQSVVKKLTDKI